MNHSQMRDAAALLAPAKTFEHNDRRTWLKTALGVGYAAACLPLSAQSAVRTSSEGLLCGEAMVNINGFQMPVYRSVPIGKTHGPVVLVVSEFLVCTNTSQTSPDAWRTKATWPLHLN